MMKFIKISILFLLVSILLPAAGNAAPAVDQELKGRVERIASEVAALRDLPFIEPLGSQVISADELKAYLTAELTDQIPPEKENAIELVYGQLGLIPTDMGFLETYEQMYEEQAGGIYDWKGKRMLIAASNLPGLGDDGGGMLSLMGADPDLILGIVLAHELCHALEDQHFKFHERFEELQDLSSSDREFALQCLVEGSATRLMIEYATGGTPLTPLQRTMNRLLTNIMTDLSLNLPLYYRRSLTAPYSLGEAFVSSLIDNYGGWQAVDRAYYDVPVSMEQVIHPEKYFGKRDYPSDVRLIDFAAIMGDDYKPLLQDTLGEMVIGILFDIQLKREDFQEAPRGWDGDRLAGVLGPDGEVTVVWHSVWDSPSDAAEFSESMFNYMIARLGGDAANLIKNGNYYIYTDDAGREYILGMEMDEVILIDNAPPGMGSTLYTAALTNDVIVRK